jgi:2,3-bisphosphoglycerate-dependent phosphoglycerate mutase
VRLYVLTRHARSTLNAAGRINGDPRVPAPLTEDGVAEAERLGTELANLAVDLCVHTRFQRTRETAAVVVGTRDVPRLEEPLLDDVDVGSLEGETVEAYRDWKRAHPHRAARFPDGESLDDAARRYAAAFRRLLARSEQTTLVVCHEIPIRYALNGAVGSADLDAPAHAIPNATPYLFDAASLARAAAGIERATGRRR